MIVAIRRKAKGRTCYANKTKQPIGSAFSRRSEHDEMKKMPAAGSVVLRYALLGLGGRQPPLATSPPANRIAAA